jgi:hypothetical protein
MANENVGNSAVDRNRLHQGGNPGRYFERTPTLGRNLQAMLLGHRRITPWAY